METVEYYIGFLYFNYWLYLYALSHHQLWKTHDSVLAGKGISFTPLSSLMSITCLQVLTRDTPQCLKIPASSHLWTDFDYWIFFFWKPLPKLFFLFQSEYFWTGAQALSEAIISCVIYISPLQFIVFFLPDSYFPGVDLSDPSYRKREGEPGF